MTPALADRLASLPTTPGVYLMKHAGGEVLYVGKALSLKDRVRSYFQRAAALTPKIRRMVGQVAEIEVMVTTTELEALMLENNLIKRHRPPYNVVLRDDKHYPYLRLSITDDFPRLEVVRRVKRDGALYFGPYVPAGALRQTLKIIRKVFPLATCEIEIDGKAERACIEYEIKRCLAPCTGNQTKEAYHRVVDQVRLFLSGRNGELLDTLKTQMQEAAERQEFEEAARLRDQVRKIEQGLERQRITTTELDDLDVVGLARSEVGTAADIQVLFVRGGMLIGRKDFYWTDAGDVPDEELITSLIQQFYAGADLIPRQILVPVRPGPGDTALLEAWLSARRGGAGAVRLLAPSRGKDFPLLRLAAGNARQALVDHLRISAVGERALVELADLLHLSRLPRRIEAVDISTIAGTNTVGSLVAWNDGRLQPSAYRHFTIKTAQGPDDFAAMREVLTRHYRRVKAAVAEHGEGAHDVRRLPDLLLIDGGKGQLAIALAVLESLEIEEIDVIGLAKARPGDGKAERVFLPREAAPVVLPPTSPATHLLMRIRDEAHRFAITHHRRVRGYTMTASVLDAVPGIGSTRKRALLKQFGSLERIRDASPAQLEAVPGMTARTAAAVHTALQAALHTIRRPS